MIAIIYDETGNIINTVIADETWLEQNYPGRWEAVPQSPAVPESQELSDVKARKKQDVTALRWEKETGGISFFGSHILTGIEDQNRIATALIGAPETIDFKSASGWVTLTFAELKAIADAITAHVQACFSTERQHHEAIDALTTVEDVESYNFNSNWPA